MTTNDYQWLHSGYILTISDYILATFWLYFWLHILTIFWLHFCYILTKNQSNYGFLCPVGFILNQVERKRVAIKACLLSQNLEFLFVFRPTFLPLVNTCHYQQSAVWYAESVLCVPGSGVLNTWKGKVLGSTLTFLSWATNKLSAIRSFRY